MFELAKLIDWRVLQVLSPITTALAWALFIADEPRLRDEEPGWY